MRETYAWLKERGFMTRGQTVLAFRAFEAWSDVVEAARHGVRLWYQAPLDRYPTSVLATRVFKNGKIRIVAPELTFTVDEGHLSRFRERVVTLPRSYPNEPQRNPSEGV